VVGAGAVRGWGLGGWVWSERRGRGQFGEGYCG